jgi:pimeloyl-ACP methyl ester carboxylesterase
VPLPEAPSADATLAYLVLVWPILDPYGRFIFAQETGRDDIVASTRTFFAPWDAIWEGNPMAILERGERVELPPALIFQGADDDVLSPRTAERFVEAYGRAGGIIELAKFPHAGHGYSRQGGPNALRTVDVLNCFVERQLKAIANGW